MILTQLERCLLLHGYGGSVHRWSCDNGHEYRKDQADECPICALAKLRLMYEELGQEKDTLETDLENEIAKHL